MALEPITDHEEQALERLLYQFKGKPKIEGMVRSFVKGFQFLEETLSQILNFRWVDTAVGAQLDGMGQIVGEERRGRNDTQYRLAIKLRIFINICQGTPDEFINIFLLLTGCTEAHYFPLYPAAVEIYGDKDFSGTLDAGPDSFAFDGGPDGLGFGDYFDSSVGGPFAALEPTDLDYYYFILQAVLPAGVLLEHFGFYEGDDAFAFDGYPKYKGFGDVFDDTVGGKFAAILI